MDVNPPFSCAKGGYCATQCSDTNQKSGLNRAIGGGSSLAESLLNKKEAPLRGQCTEHAAMHASWRPERLVLGEFCGAAGRPLLAGFCLRRSSPAGAV